MPYAKKHKKKKEKERAKKRKLNGEFKKYYRKRDTSDWNKGAKNPSWKGGITPRNIKIRNSKEYKLWRESVFKRDNWTCIWCGQVSGNLNADHIKPFALFPELRFAIDNGRTLCLDCHKTTESYGRSKTNKKGVKIWKHK